MDVEAGKLYRHFKGNVYRVLCVALHTDTLNPMVIYSAVDDDKNIWARPLKEFTDEVIQNDTKVTAPTTKVVGFLES